MRRDTVFLVFAATLLVSTGCRHVGGQRSYATVADPGLSRHARAVAINGHGVDLAEAGDFDEAERAFREALRLDPGLATARNNSGYLLLTYYRRYYLAALEFSAAVRLSPQSVEPRLGLARLYEIVGMPEKSVAHYEQVLTIDPANTEAAARLAMISAGMELTPRGAPSVLRKAAVSSQTTARRPGIENEIPAPWAMTD